MEQRRHQEMEQLMGTDTKDVGTTKSHHLGLGIGLG